MDYAKFSKQEFVQRGLDTPAARQLADELQDDVRKEMHQAVFAMFSSIVEGLNAQGHSLKPNGEIVIGDLAFRDEPIEGFCHLRLACDVVISAGYAGTEPPSRAREALSK